jgi:hypothetical protein
MFGTSAAKLKEKMLIPKEILEEELLKAQK